MGPLSDWQVHSPRSHYTIQLPSDFTKRQDRPWDSEFWGLVEYFSPSNSVAIVIEDGPNHLIEEDLFDVAGQWLNRYYSTGGYLFDIQSFQSLSKSNSVLRGSYRMFGNRTACDLKVDALFVRGETHTYRVRVSVCDSARWKYDAEFADRVLNSFTY